MAIYLQNGRKMREQRESQDIFRISMHTKLRRKWEKSSNCDFCWMPSVSSSLWLDGEMIVAKIFAINKVAAEKDDEL